MKVSVIIPNWNGKKLLAKNLPKVIKASVYKKNNILEIIIVDDKSTDNSVRFLEKNFDGKTKIVRQSENRGFASTVNLGVARAKGDLVCLLNTDVIPSKNFLERAIKHFKNNQVFAVGLHEKGYGPSTGEFKNGYLEHKNAGELKEVSPTLWVSGGSGVFSKKIWRKLKGLDEKLYSPFYWEDVDLCYRAHKRGFELLWEPDSLVEHKHESVINEDNFNKRHLDIIKERNILLFHWKNITSEKYFNQHIVRLFTRSSRHIGYMRVIVEAVKSRKVVLKRRESEKREAVLSDEAVFAKFK